MAIKPVTFVFQAKDFISERLRKMGAEIRRTSEDVIGLRSTTEKMYDSLASGGQKVQKSMRDIRDQVGAANNEMQSFARKKMDDIFGRAKKSADDFRSEVKRADDEVRSMNDATVHLQAKDEASPTLDGITSKLATIAATAGRIFIGVFDGATEYWNEAARLAPYMSKAERESALKKADDLYGKGFFESRVEAVKVTADIAPLVSDKKQLPSFVESLAKMKYIMPDSRWEELSRALGQSTNVFEETPQQVTDSMMYAYSKVGDRKQDLANTFWESALYFKNANLTSAQMSNFLVQSVQKGAFNYDKPADWFKEAFGVKALNEGDMAKYFEHRGSSKDVAKKQAKEFVADINSGDRQKSQGAIMALVADLASQERAERKASLVMLGSAVGADLASSILETYGVALEKPPDEIAGTTDRMIKAQKDANPMMEWIEARRQMDLIMQEIGGNVAQTFLPLVKKMNTLLVENKSEIQGFIVAITSGLTKITGFYKEHTGLINGILGTVLAVGIALKAWTISKRTIDTIKDIKSTIGSVARKLVSLLPGRKKGNDVLPERRRFTLKGSDPIHSVSSVTINAARVYINGPVDGGRGVRTRDEIGGGRKKNSDTTPRRRKRTIPREVAGEFLRRGRPEPKPKKSVFSRFKDFVTGNRNKIEETGLEQADKLARMGKFVKGAGVVGTVAGTALAGYDMYQAAKEKGWREAISTKGGAMAGGALGGMIFVVGSSILGPVGTMVGAAAGNWIGTKLGALADQKGWTKNIVDGVVSAKEKMSEFTSDAVKKLTSLKDKVSSWWRGDKGKTKEVQSAVASSSFFFPSFTPEGKKKIQNAITSLRNSLKEKGIEIDLSPLQKAGTKVKDAFTMMKKNVTGWWKSSDSKKAQDDMKAVGTSTQKTTAQAKQLGVTTAKSTQQVVQGAKQAGRSFTDVKAAATNAVAQIKQKLESLGDIVSKGQNWGSNLISMVISGMRSQFPTLTSVVSSAAGIIKNFLGFSSPTKEGPASKSDRWAPNFIHMFVSGIDEHIVGRKMNRVAAMMNQPLRGRASLDVVPHSRMASGSGIPVAKAFQGQANRAANINIGKIVIDMGQLMKNVSDPQAVLRILSSREAHGIIINTVEKALINALENG
ncbi:hypothetical protein [Aneurinibacillus thermoaerophilus]|uniref:hypothetical protein n=1 Tax=Aneurinibacillus thermoaerophilus TaxID=143495 RepID=UPI002E20D2F2|nr:hypothetical protein [Aneurinibacillus thermoaerophilus]